MLPCRGIDRPVWEAQVTFIIGRCGATVNMLTRDITLYSTRLPEPVQ